MLLRHVVVPRVKANQEVMEEGNLQDWAPIYFKKRSFINRLANRQDFLDDKVRTLSYLRNFLI